MERPAPSSPGSADCASGHHREGVLMNKLELTRRQALIAAAAAGVTYMVGTRKAEAFTAPASLVEAAKKEGKMVIYTASFIEVMQEDIRAFQKIYPWAQIE